MKPLTANDPEAKSPDLRADDELLENLLAIDAGCVDPCGEAGI